MLYAVCTPCIVALSCTTSPGAVRFPLPPGATITSTIRRRYWYEPSAAVCYREHWSLPFCCGLETGLTACTARHRLLMLVRPRRCRLVTPSWTAEVTVSASGCCWRRQLLPTGRPVTKAVMPRDLSHGLATTPLSHGISSAPRWE